MQTRIHGKIVFECDSCAESLDTQEGQFAEARNALREAEWKSHQRGGIWFHYCDECEPNQRKEIEAEGQRHFKGFL
jgi:hypothetical protein